jgi:endonuclease/exonuclease/phosphatase family metal-dependent hydrolase
VQLLTWNVWFGAQQFRPRTAGLVREIARRRPDVIALQEVTPALRAILDYELAGYTLHGGQSPFGYDVMLLTRGEVRDFAELELPSEMGRRAIAVELASGLTVATVHLESTAPCVKQRAAQLALIGPWLAARTEDAILVGDMNFDDFAATESDVLDESYVDLWQAMRRKEPGYTVDSVINTMRSDLRGKVQKRIDRAFLCSARWRAESIALVGTEPIDIHDTFVSDHFGLAVELAGA